MNSAFSPFKSSCGKKSANHRPRTLTRLCCHASDDKRSEGTNTKEEPSNQMKDRQTLTDPQKLRLQKVEKLGPEAWSGVASVDKERQPGEATLGRTLALISGDFAALMVFAAIGRGSHGKSLDAVSVLTTAAPFLIGWFGAADLQKAFGKEAQSQGVKAAAKKAGVIWATGVPVGILVRSAQQGHVPNPAFVVVSLMTTFAFLVGWRTAFAASMPTLEEQKGGQASKRGNPLEFLQLLASLTTRWRLMPKIAEKCFFCIMYTKLVTL